MKYISLFFISIFVIISFYFNTNIVDASGFFTSTLEEGPYCNDEPCGLLWGIKTIIGVEGLENELTASQYIQLVIKYIIGFVAILATFLIIYAGFNLLISVGDEEKAKKSKKIILYTILGVFLIFIASPFFKFIIEVLVQ